MKGIIIWNYGKYSVPVVIDNSSISNRGKDLVGIKLTVLCSFLLLRILVGLGTLLTFEFTSAVSTDVFYVIILSKRTDKLEKVQKSSWSMKGWNLQVEGSSQSLYCVAQGTLLAQHWKKIRFYTVAAKKVSSIVLFAITF